MAAKTSKTAELPKPIPGLGTAEGDALRDALKAFDAGDHQQVREITARLTTAKDEAVREAATALGARVAVDPLQIVVFAACAAVLLAIAYVWVF